jgi:hypothetical protein
MGTYPEAEVLALIAHHKELIETSKKTIECSDALVKQSRRLTGYHVDKEKVPITRRLQLALGPLQRIREIQTPDLRDRTITVIQ